MTWKKSMQSRHSYKSRSQVREVKENILTNRSKGEPILDINGHHKGIIPLLGQDIHLSE